MTTRLSKSVIGQSEIAAVTKVLKEGYLGMGQYVQRFEEELETYIGQGRHVVCVSSGTAALQLALQAHGVGAGDEVLVPSLTYVASYQAITAVGAFPIPVDVSISTGFLCPKDLITKLSDATKAIMPVHYAGSCIGIESIYEIAKLHNLIVIEDAAHSFGGSYANKKIGSFGGTICFSFDGIKNITCGEGGAIVFEDKAIADKVRDIRLLAVQRDTEKRYTGSRSWDFQVMEQGWRYHMSNIMAAIGSEQLKRISDFRDRRLRICRLYRSLLCDVKAINFFDFDQHEFCPHIFPVKVDENCRKKLRLEFSENNIEFGTHYKPNHYLSYFNLGEYKLRNTEILWERLMSLPLHADLSDNEVEKICQIVKKVCKQG